MNPSESPLVAKTHPTLALGEMAEGVVQTHNDYLSALDEISKSVRDLEALLRKSGVKVPYKYEIMNHLKLAETSISWESIGESDEFRLFYSRTTLVHFDDRWFLSGETITRPIIEWPVQERLNAYKHIPEFLARYQAHLYEARFVVESTAWRIKEATEIPF